VLPSSNLFMADSLPLYVCVSMWLIKQSQITNLISFKRGKKKLVLLIQSISILVVFVKNKLPFVLWSCPSWRRLVPTLCPLKFDLKRANLLKAGTYGRQQNGIAHIRHQSRKTAVLSCHRCLINSVVGKMNNI